jgi:hypothetical protein
MVRFGEKRWSIAPPFLLPLIEEPFNSITLPILAIKKISQMKEFKIS